MKKLFLIALSAAIAATGAYVYGTRQDAPVAQGGGAAGGKQGGEGGGRPVPVAVGTVRSGDIDLAIDALGTVVAYNTALVKARIDNPKSELKPGMFANLNLTLKLKEDAIVIPESSVIASGDRNIIYVLDKEDTAQIRPVKIGIRQAGLVEIVSGLKPGERVVAEGIQKIRPGGKVKAAAAAPAATGGKS